MDFDLTDDQKEIKRVAHELLADRSPLSKVREAAEAGAYDPALWRELAELGWPGIAVSEEHGGQGLGAVELAVLLEELGYACAATPFLSTATAAAVIQAAGTPEQQAKWLPGLASGELTAGIGTRGAGRRRRRRRGRGADRRLRRGADRGARRRAADLDRLDQAVCHRRAATASRWAPGRWRGSTRRSPPRSSASASARST